MARTRMWCMLVTGFSLLLGSGCSHFPLLIGAAPVPVPVPPWVSERMEQKYADRLKVRTPIMPPILPGTPIPTCDDPPSEEEIIRAIPPVIRGIPYVIEEFRDDYTFVTEKLVDTIDPCVYVPLVGPVQLHHCHYKCTVFYKQRIRSDYPFPFTVVNDKRVDVYIDKDHFHLCVGTDPAMQRSIANDFNNPY